MSFITKQILDTLSTLAERVVWFEYIGVPALYKAPVWNHFSIHHGLTPHCLGSYICAHIRLTTLFRPTRYPPARLPRASSSHGIVRSTASSGVISQSRCCARDTGRAPAQPASRGVFRPATALFLWRHPPIAPAASRRLSPRRPLRSAPLRTRTPAAPVTRSRCCKAFRRKRIARRPA